MEGEFLTRAAAQEISGEILAAREGLLCNKALVVKRSAQQWRFFSDCIDRLVFPGSSSEFDRADSRRLVSLKFEVENKLRRYYERPGKSVDYVFVMAHKRNLQGYPTGEEYPDIGGYCVLVRPLASEASNLPAEHPDVVSEILDVVSRAADAEFDAYAALPNISLEAVDRYFCNNGPARDEIQNLLYRHSAKGWVISNHMNPSTKRLLSISLKSWSQSEATVKTTEYWYLRWYSSMPNRYTYIYRETNRQTYILKREDEVWKVFQNLRPSPRSGAPSRRKTPQG